MSKPIVLLGDLGLDHDGYPPTPVISGSPNVMVDGKPVARVGDQLAMHSKPSHPPHPRAIAEGSSTVMINGVPAAITGGKISCGGVTVGSGSVLIGDSPAAAPFSGSTPLPKRPEAAPMDGETAAKKVKTNAESSSAHSTPPPAQLKQKEGPTGETATANTQAAAEEDSGEQSVEPGFHIVRQPMSKAEILTHLYGDVSLKPNRFDELNPQVGEHILPGQMVVLGDPEGLQCTAKEQKLMTVAKQVNAKASELTDEEAQFAADYHDLIETITSTSSAGLGAGAVMVSKQMSVLDDTLRELERLHQESYRKHGHLSHPEFFEKRQALFKKLDFALGSIARKGMSLDNDAKLKRALGLSSKSIVSHWKKAGIGDIPGYATNYDRIASGAKYAKSIGYLAIGLDIAASGVKVRDACTTGRANECKRVKYTEGGRLSGSLLGGGAGAFAGPFLCGVLGLGTGGLGGVACGILMAGAGGFAGGSVGGGTGEDIGEVIYEVTSE
ncbi:MAG: type VI secretion system PAAR protein [Pseudomonadota bacterium]|nr:type VI secretion system PAAR protein [Pseudomonadota bacterium]